MAPTRCNLRTGTVQRIDEQPGGDRSAPRIDPGQDRCRTIGVMHRSGTYLSSGITENRRGPRPSTPFAAVLCPFDMCVGATR